MTRLGCRSAQPIAWHSPKPDCGSRCHIRPVCRSHTRTFSARHLHTARQQLRPRRAIPAPNNPLNCAGLQATNGIAAQTKTTHLEWGDFIYTGTAGYQFTSPFSGTGSGLPTFYQHMGDVPSGGTIVGWYHSHPLIPNGPTPELFSGAGGDLGVSQYLRVPGFLTTPSGALKRLDPSGRVTTINKATACSTGLHG